MDNKIFKRLIKEALTPDFLKEEEIKHEGQSCDEAHPGLTHEEWEFEQSKKDSPEFWKDIWKVQKESVNGNEKNTIVVYNGKRLGVSTEDLQRLKLGKDIVGKSTKHPGQEEWISAIGKWKVEEQINESIPSNIRDFAQERDVLPLVKKVDRWAQKVGKRVVGGTAIGKHYSTLILDLTYQGSEVNINTETDEIKINGEEVYDLRSFKDALDESVNEAVYDNPVRKKAKIRYKDHKVVSILGIGEPYEQIGVIPKGKYTIREGDEEGRYYAPRFNVTLLEPMKPFDLAVELAVETGWISPWNYLEMKMGHHKGGGRILTFPPPPTLFDEPVNEDARGAYADIPTLNKHPDILNLIKNVEELVGIEVEADLRGYGGKGKGFYLTTPSLKFWEDDDKNLLKDAFNKTNNESGELTFEFQITDNYEMDPGERSWDAGFSFTVDEKI